MSIESRLSALEEVTKTVCTVLHEETNFLASTLWRPFIEENGLEDAEKTDAMLNLLLSVNSRSEHQQFLRDIIDYDNDDLNQRVFGRFEAELLFKVTFPLDRRKEDSKIASICKHLKTRKESADVQQCASTSLQTLVRESADSKRISDLTWYSLLQFPVLTEIFLTRLNEELPKSKRVKATKALLNLPEFDQEAFAKINLTNSSVKILKKGLQFGILNSFQAVQELCAEEAAGSSLRI